jgi:hypothetical protein
MITTLSHGYDGTLYHLYRTETNRKVCYRPDLLVQRKGPKTTWGPVSVPIHNWNCLLTVNAKIKYVIKTFIRKKCRVGGTDDQTERLCAWCSPERSNSGEDREWSDEWSRDASYQARFSRRPLSDVSGGVVKRFDHKQHQNPLPLKIKRIISPRYRRDKSRLHGGRE